MFQDCFCDDLIIFKLTCVCVTSCLLYFKLYFWCYIRLFLVFRPEYVLWCSLFTLQVDDVLFRHLSKQLANHVQSLSLNGVYWLSGSTMEHLGRCKAVTHLDVTGCHVTSLRLSRLLSFLTQLRSLAFDVRSGFNAAQLSSEAVDRLSRLSELRQTLLTPSYGVVPCCAQLRKYVYVSL